MSERAVTDNSMGCDEVQELLPLYALGALDQDEAEAIASHMPLCPSCSADLVRFDSVTGALAAPLAPVAPDASVRAGLFDRIAVTPQEVVAPITPIAQVPPANVVSINRSRSSTWRTWLVSAAAVLLVLGGGAGYWINSMANDRDDAQQTAALLAEFMAPNATSIDLPVMN
ncbi:MAG: zf-HC2 domain-containing protein, partial [Thermomicrobiales bacterium]